MGSSIIVMTELDQLMQPVAGESPVGPDLSYDPERQEIENAFEMAKRADNGEGDAPDWTSVIGLIKQLSARSKDAWLAVYLVRAGARSQQLETVALGCEFLAEMLETWWDEMHPLLEDLGFQGRKGACDSLASYGDFVLPLRRVVVVEHARLGRYTGEDLERFAGEGEQADGIGMFRAAIADLPSEELETTLARIDSIRSGLGRVDAVLTNKAEGTTGTNFVPTYEALDKIRLTLRGLAGVSEAASPTDILAAGSEDIGGGASPSAAFAPLVGGGGIGTRGDVVRALEAVIDYYGRNEPGSPIPVVLNRAKSWVYKDFLAILDDIAPTSVDDAKRVLTTSVV